MKGTNAFNLRPFLIARVYHFARVESIDCAQCLQQFLIITVGKEVGKLEKIIGWIVAHNCLVAFTFVNLLGTQRKESTAL